MPLKKRRTPQEKKELSYTKDRRNSYGENDKASRRLIPLQKKLANRKVRRSDKVLLSDNPSEAPLKRPKPHWKKEPDEALGALLEGPFDECTPEDFEFRVDRERRLIKQRKRRLKTSKSERKK